MTLSKNQMSSVSPDQFCKHSYLIKSSDEVAEVLASAMHIASTGRPGPVVIDFAKDAQIHESLFHYPERVDIRSYKPKVDGHPRQIAKAVELIHNAERPMLYAGGGVVLSNGCEELRELAIKTGIPITVNAHGPRSLSGDASAVDADARHAWFLLRKLCVYRFRSRDRGRGAV